MKNSVKFVLTSIAIGAFFLTGCSEADMATMNQMTSQFNTIANNVNTIAAKTSQIDTTTINKGVASIAESATEIADNTAETVEYVNEISEDINVLAGNEITREDILEAYEDTPIAAVISYPERNEKALADAKAKYNKGIEMITEGYNGLVAMPNNTKTVKGTVRDSFDYAEEIIVGANTVSEAINDLRKEYASMSNDMIEVADILGVEGDNVDALRDITALTEMDIDLFVIPEETIDQMRDAEAEILLALNKPETVDEVDVDAVIDEVFDELKPVTDNVTRINKNISVVAKLANRAAQDIIEEVEKYGTGDPTADETIEYIDGILKEYEDADIYVIDIDGTGDANKLVDYVRSEVKKQVDGAKNIVKKQLESEKE